VFRVSDGRAARSANLLGKNYRPDVSRRNQSWLLCGLEAFPDGAEMGDSRLATFVRASAACSIWSCAKTVLPLAVACWSGAAGNSGPALPVRACIGAALVPDADCLFGPLPHLPLPCLGVAQAVRLRRHGLYWMRDRQKLRLCRPRGQLQDQALAAAWSDDQSMTFEQSIAYASDDDEHSARMTGCNLGIFRLNVREQPQGSSGDWLRQRRRALVTQEKLAR
jgi:hypothetical protein